MPENFIQVGLVFDRNVKFLSRNSSFLIKTLICFLLPFVLMHFFECNLNFFINFCWLYVCEVRQDFFRTNRFLILDDREKKIVYFSVFQIFFVIFLEYLYFLVFVVEELLKKVFNPGCTILVSEEPVIDCCRLLKRILAWKEHIVPGNERQAVYEKTSNFGGLAYFRNFGAHLLCKMGLDLKIFPSLNILPRHQQRQSHKRSMIYL